MDNESESETNETSKIEIHFNPNILHIELITFKLVEYDIGLLHNLLLVNREIHNIVNERKERFLKLLYNDIELARSIIGADNFKVSCLPNDTFKNPRLAQLIVEKSKYNLAIICYYITTDEMITRWIYTYRYLPWMLHNKCYYTQPIIDAILKSKSYTELNWIPEKYKNQIYYDELINNNINGFKECILKNKDYFMSIALINGMEEIGDIPKKYKKEKYHEYHELLEKSVRKVRKIINKRYFKLYIKELQNLNQ